MGITRNADEQLQKSLQQARELLEEIKQKRAELQLIRQSLPEGAHRAEVLELESRTTDVLASLRTNMKAADLVARKVEGQVLWKAAVWHLWGDEGLQRCYAKLRELEAQRAEDFNRDDLLKQ